jgi:hypothetical protein
VVQLQDQEKAEENTKNKVNQHKKFTPTLWANFDQNYQPINSGYPSATAQSYSVRDGDTLRAIADDCQALVL